MGRVEGGKDLNSEEGGARTVPMKFLPLPRPLTKSSTLLRVQAGVVQSSLREWHARAGAPAGVQNDLEAAP